MIKVNYKEVNDGKRWFIIGGSLGIALSVALLKIDDYLTYSTGERDKGNLLLEIRNAQAHLPGRANDSRNDDLLSIFKTEVEKGQDKLTTAVPRLETKEKEDTDEQEKKS